MAEHYKLVYGDIRGRAEVIRLTLVVAGQEFDDFRIDFYKDWPKLKETTPLGQVPYLETEGMKIPQTPAILRFLGRKHGLYGTNDMEKLQIDIAFDTSEDMIKENRKYIYEKDESEQAKIKKAYIEEKSSIHLDRLEKLLKLNNGGDGFFVGNQISFADMAVFNEVHQFYPLNLNTQVTHPKLKAHSERIAAIPAVADWLKKSPKTKM